MSRKLRFGCLSVVVFMVMFKSLMVFLSKQVQELLQKLSICYGLAGSSTTGAEILPWL